VSEYEQKPYKEHIRIEGAVSDLQAVEAMYHQDCMSVSFQTRTQLVVNQIASHLLVRVQVIKHTSML
jgi:hypothetical protein